MTELKRKSASDEDPRNILIVVILTKRNRLLEMCNIASWQLRIAQETRFFHVPIISRNQFPVGMRFKVVGIRNFPHADLDFSQERRFHEWGGLDYF